MTTKYPRIVTFTSPSARVRHVAAVRAAKILHLPAPKATPMLHVSYTRNHFARAFSTKFRAH